MEAYNEKEIDLAKRIYESTMLVSGRITTRRLRNWAKKHGTALPLNELPAAIYLETARNLLARAEQELDQAIKIAVENLDK